MLRFPGLIDPHVHMREPGAVHKEDWISGTRAALVGGFTLVLAMPNTQPPVTGEKSWQETIKTAGLKAMVDFNQFAGATLQNVSSISKLSGKAAGLKLYLDQTYGPLKLDDQLAWENHLKNWPVPAVVSVHAEGNTLADFLEIVEKVRRPVHICHVATQEDILMVKKAKQAGLPVTCEATAHHLFLTEDDLRHLPSGFKEVRPRLGMKRDQTALWENMGVIDCFASDHAPHTVEEKSGENPPPGFPGLETSLPLFLTAMTEGRLSEEDLLLRSYTNPKRIFHLVEQSDTWIEINPSAKWEIRAEKQHTRCGWTPFEGMPVTGCLNRVVFYGKEVFREGEIFIQPGEGRFVPPFRTQTHNQLEAFSPL